MSYAGFEKRLFANLIDVLVLFPLTIVLIVAYRQTRNLTLLLTVFGSLLSWAYTIFFHARWGQTLGKKAVNIRVVKVSGEPISWREAVLRSSVDILLRTLVIIGTLIALLHFPEAEYGQLTRAQWSKHLAELSPVWLSWVNILSNIWFWSEFVTLLFNTKKRALHDFMAGTVVVQEQAVTLEKAAPNSVG